MPNPAVAKFLKQLIGAFCKYPVIEGKKEVYLKKLSSFRLSDDQWDRVLDHLIDKRTDKTDELPELKEIYTEIRNVNSINRKLSDRAWAYFDLNGKNYALRLRNDQGVWVKASMLITDRNGNKIELQKNVGQAFIPPEDAEDLRVIPDNEFEQLTGTNELGQHRLRQLCENIGQEMK
jgi:hypothetical protein